MDWVQLHLALNHVPVIGVPLLTLMLGAAWVFRQPQVVRFVMWCLLVLAGLAIAIKFTGDFAADALQQELAPLREMVTAHEESADQATTGVFFLGVAAAAALFAGRKGRLIPLWALAATLVVGLATSLLYARSAHKGGLIKHPELHGISARDMEAGNVSVRLHHGGTHGAKPKAEVVADALAGIKERGRRTALPACIARPASHSSVRWTTNLCCSETPATSSRSRTSVRLKSWRRF